MRKSVILSETLRIDSQGRLIASTIWEGDSTIFVITGMKNHFGEPVFLCNAISIVSINKK